MGQDATQQISATVSDWVSRLAYDALPDDVVTATTYRILDVLGLSIAGGQTPFGKSVFEAAQTLYPGQAGRIWGTRATTSTIGAAFTNGALSQALEYDDTHNESVVHMSSPAVGRGPGAGR